MWESDVREWMHECMSEWGSKCRRQSTSCNICFADFGRCDGSEHNFLEACIDIRVLDTAGSAVAGDVTLHSSTERRENCANVVRHGVYCIHHVLMEELDCPWSCLPCSGTPTLMGFCIRLPSVRNDLLTTQCMCATYVYFCFRVARRIFLHTSIEKLSGSIPASKRKNSDLRAGKPSHCKCMCARRVSFGFRILSRIFTHTSLRSCRDAYQPCKDETEISTLENIVAANTCAQHESLVFSATGSNFVQTSIEKLSWAYQPRKRKNKIFSAGNSSCQNPCAQHESLVFSGHQQLFFRVAHASLEHEWLRFLVFTDIPLTPCCRAHQFENAKLRSRRWRKFET